MSFSLDQIADEAGRFAILAMDQRGTLRTMLDKAGEPSADEDMSAFKVEVIGTLSPFASGVLTDVEYGVGPARDAGVLNPDTGLLIASERSPQPMWKGEHRVSYLPERGPAFVAANGGAALKFLIRWQPDRPAVPGEPDLAREAVDAVRAVIADCRAYGMPSVIESLVAKGSIGDGQLVVRGAQVLSELGPDLLKLEWPGDADGCRELTKVCGPVPWALLSAGVDFDAFIGRVVVAMDAGASGFIAGRSLWGEAVTLTGAQRREFLASTASDRLARVNKSIAGHGRSWREVAGR